MTKKEEMRVNLLTKMKPYIDETAAAVLDNLITEALYNVDIVELETGLATNEMTNDYIVEIFMQMKAQMLSEKSVEAYLQTVREFAGYINKSFLHVTEFDVRRYLSLKKQQGNSAVSLNNKKRNLAAFFAWMRKTHIITENPAENIERYKEIEKPIDHLTPVEFEQLKTGCKSKRDRALIEWLRCTAMRGGELPLVKVNQINWSDKIITILGEKGYAYRPVCLDDVAIRYIKEYLDERGVSFDSDEPLFTRLRGDKTKAITRNSICQVVKAIGVRAELKHNIYTHLFRKTTATTIVSRGGSENDAGFYLGHKPSGVTGKHYTYHSDDHALDIFKKYVAM